MLASPNTLDHFANVRFVVIAVLRQPRDNQRRQVLLDGGPGQCAGGREDARHGWAACAEFVAHGLVVLDVMLPVVSDFNTII